VGLQGVSRSDWVFPKLYEPAHAFVVASKVCDLPTMDIIVINHNAQPRTYTNCVRWASSRNLAVQVYRR